uniref:FERM and PDZ domain-containing protein 1 n=1 Tax=Oncorhynchus kisutch TaxID=8019 RepID=A0A8C7N3L5_ONCKI
MMRKRILCVCVWVAGPADGRLIPGDQVVKINNVAVDDLTPEQAADLIRECQHSVMITVLRNSGPKSSFITPEKRAKLRSNPVKVRFAEEVEVNSHSQGNSLLFLPNVLKVYLENGQTKAFKFEPNTTVKDIVMTLKEKLSLSRIEHFSLVLEQKYSISKLLLLHEEERIQQVVHQKEVHDYRCLFRVCFIPREPEHLLQDDPTAFQYLYLQGINDVLQERFAVEMRCNTALRLAALHIQERLASCGQSPRTKLKIITKSWGIENFISSTLLRNMREKDLRKAIGYHMKKSQSQEPKQKVLSANQAKINYLEELCDLKSFGGKSFSATMMLQDRESMVTLLVGSRYGISQVVNHKLSIMTTLTEFSSITRIELLPESDRVSLVKIYLQDIKPITLLLESVAAKELSCLVAGYCRALVDPSLIIFPWTQDGKQHRVSAEEGGERKGEEERGGGERKEEEERGGGERKGEEERGGGEVRGAMTEEHRSVSEEASDSCRTDSRFMTSISSDSLDALEEDDLIACSSSLPHPHPPFPWVNSHHSPMTPDSINSEPVTPVVDPSENLNYAELSLMLEYLPSPPEASDDEDEEEKREERRRSNEGTGQEVLSSDARHYYNICPNVTPDSTRSLTHPHPETEEEEGGGEEEEQGALLTLEPVPILQPPPGFGDSSSDEEFFDARDRIASPEDPTSGTVSRGVISLAEGTRHEREAGREGETSEGGGGRDMFSRLSRKRSKKRRSFMQTDFTSTVSYPGPDQNQDSDESQQLSLDPEPSEQSQNPCPTVSSLSHAEGEASQLESKPILAKPSPEGSSRNRRQSMETEPDMMESKSVTALVTAASLSITAVRCRVEPDGKESPDRNANLAMTNANSANANSATANIPKESPISPTTGFLLRPCSPGIIGQSLSASTLRGKIQSLPLYLSRSQETLTLSGVGSPNRSPSPETTSNKTEVMVTTETTKYDDVTKVATGEDLKDSGVALVESDDSEVTLTESEVGEVVVETAGAEITRLTVSEVKEVIEKVVMVYGSSLPPPLAPISLESKPDPKMVVKLPTCPIATVETAPPMAPAPICLEPKPVPELLSPGSTIHKMAAPLPSCPSFRVPIRVEPKPDHEPLSIRSKMAALSSSYPPALVVTTESLNSSSSNPHPIRVEPMPEPCLEPFSGPKMSAPLSSCPSALVVTTQSLVVTTQSLVVTTQSLNGPGLSFPSSNMRGQPFGSNSFCRPPGEEAGLLNTLTTGCGVFTSTCETQPNQAHMESYSPAKPDFGCSSVLASGCETVMEGVQTPLEACRCPPPLVYTNCFSGGDSFDDELTVYEFSCRTSSPPASQPSSSALALPLTTSPPLSSFLSSSPPSSLLSPSFPRSVLPPSSSMELSPLLSPLLSPSNCFLSQSSLHDDISRLRHRRFPPPPAGFQNVRSDVDELLTLLQGGRMGSRGGRHPRETCATHFSENKRLLHGEARRLMAGCQKVVRVGQTPDEMLFSLSDSFRTLVGMAGMCLWFSGCDRCDRRNAEALAGLADVARTYREFVLAAERASGRRSCHDLSTKLLAKQCTALTASVFCLTQLFRTLTAL